jgi:hypothetical protein
MDIELSPHFFRQPLGEFHGCILCREFLHGPCGAVLPYAPATLDARDNMHALFRCGFHLVLPEYPIWPIL